MTTLGQQIVNSLLTEPTQWTQGPYVIAHRNGIALWTANIPIFHLDINRPFAISLTWSDKWHIFWAIRRHNHLILQNLWSNQ